MISLSFLIITVSPAPLRPEIDEEKIRAITISITTGHTTHQVLCLHRQVPRRGRRREAVRYLASLSWRFRDMFCSFIGYGVQEVEVVTGPSQWNDNASWEVEVVTGPSQWMSFDGLS